MAVSAVPAHPQRVLVLGWYGTETIGDLAILAGIVGDYRREHPGVSFTVVSLSPPYTRHNLTRLGLGCDVVSYGDPELLGDLWNCDTVIVGGGPLMDLPQLPWIAGILERAKMRGCRTIVEGCGVGPVNLPATSLALQRIMAAADLVKLRDHGSAGLLRTIGITRPVDIVDDPARRWVLSTGVRWRQRREGPICIFAREPSWEYLAGFPLEGVIRGLTTFLHHVCEWAGDREVRLHAMHWFPVGGDDRRFAHRLRALAGRDTVRVDDVPRTPRETVEIMADAGFVVCMRFHSLVFAHAIGAPLLGIDYTSGGKIAHYAADHGLTRRCVSLKDVARVDRYALAGLGEPGHQRAA